MMTHAGCSGYNPVGGNPKETTEFIRGNECIARVGNRGRPRRLDWSPEQYYRVVGGGCSFTSHRGQESKHPVGGNQIKGDLIEECLLRSQVAHQMH